MNRSAEIQILAELSSIPPSLRFLADFSGNLGASPAQVQNLGRACDIILQRIVQGNADENHKGTIRVEMNETAGGLVLRIENHGCPIYLEDVEKYRDGSALDLVRRSRGFSALNFNNRGRKGQAIVMEVPIEKSPSSPETKEACRKTKGFRLLQLGPDDARRLSRLFYHVYKYRYINEYVYFPEKLAEMLSSGSLVSMAAEDPANGELIGHVGLLRWNDSPPVYEAALGVVDPRYKNGGVFSKVFGEVMNRAAALPMQYCVFDFVTNHDYSQKQVAKHGFYDLALFLGSQVAETQAKLEELGMGEDPANTDRYSLLMGIGPRVAHPFGRQVVLPANLGESCDFLIKPLGLEWIPAPRFSPLADSGDYSLKLQEEQKAALFDLTAPGRQVVERIIDEWRRLLREGYQYVAIDVPIDPPGLGQLYDALAKRGFFISGFIPYHFGDRLGFRFQFLTPTNVDFSAIKMVTETGRKLLETVKASYERNSLL